jgi:hypothetical protein
LLTATNEPTFGENDPFKVWPNPVARELNFNEVTDAAIFDMNGKLVRVFRNTQTADVSGLTPGTYIVKNQKGDVVKLIVQ